MTKYFKTVRHTRVKIRTPYHEPVRETGYQGYSVKDISETAGAAGFIR